MIRKRLGIGRSARIMGANHHTEIGKSEKRKGQRKIRGSQLQSIALTDTHRDVNPTSMRWAKTKHAKRQTPKRQNTKTPKHQNAKTPKRQNARNANRKHTS
jgi:hypothetical protein